jgi:assimilatory nitrate reductase catalytic subunit
MSDLIQIAPSDLPRPLDPADTDMRETASTCPYCGVGCGVLIQTRGEGAQTHVVGVRGDPAHPANRGRLCSKGSGLHLTAAPSVQQHARIAEPQLRRHRGEALAPSSWDEALDLAADRFAQCIEQHGPDSVAFYLSGQLLTEDYHAFNKLARAVVGTNNIDTNSRLCMSSAVAGYKRTLGADAPPSCYEDIDHAQCLFIAGSNTAWAHPVLFRRIEAARQARPSLKIIVVDPRRTETAAYADLHLAILPGTDVALYNAMLHHMLWQGWVDRDWIDAHTEGFEALRETVRECSPQLAARICGVEAADIERAAQWFAGSGPTLSLYCQGLNQSASGTDKNAALINLHLATAQIGRPGTGPFSLTGQPNAMGGREVGGLANLLPGHREVDRADHRAQIARLWGVETIPANPGLTAVELFDALATGRVKMVWIACTNPAQSMPDLARVHEALARAELVVLQEAFAGTATAQFADVLLPATTWGEKEGTVTNSERRISRVRAALPPFGQARHDWAIAAQFGRTLEARLRPGKPSLLGWSGVQAVWEEHRASTEGRDLDICGLSYAFLEEHGPQQWPFPKGASSGQPRLYEQGRFATESGRARFAAARYRPVAEAVDARFPVRLTTGRLRDQWHGMSRTALAGRLFSHSPEPAVELHPLELTRRGWGDGELIRVASRRGSQILPVRSADSVRPGTAFVAMHWGPEFVSGRQGERASLGVNGLTLAAVDPVSRQPELKHCAVRLERYAPRGEVVVAAALQPGQAASLRRRLGPWIGRMDYGCCVPFQGPDADGILVRLADSEAIEETTLEALQALFEVPPHSLLRYDDARRATTRRLWVHEGRLRYLMLAGDCASQGWLRDLLVRGAPVAQWGYRLLLASAQAPAGLQARGATVCSCHGVDETAIDAVLEGCDGDAVSCMADLQKALSCGTSCGSCLPRLRQIIATRRAGSAALGSLRGD